MIAVHVSSFWVSTDFIFYVSERTSYWTVLDTNDIPSRGTKCVFEALLLDPRIPTWGFFYRKCSRLTQTNATHPSTTLLSPLILHSEWMWVLEPVPAVASSRWIAGPHRKTTNTQTPNAKGSEWELNLQLSSTFRCSNSHLWPNSGCCCARDDLTITSTFSWKKSGRSVLTSSSLQCLHFA